MVRTTASVDPNQSFLWLLPIRKHLTEDTFSPRVSQTSPLSGHEETSRLVGVLRVVQLPLVKANVLDRTAVMPACSWQVIDVLDGTCKDRAGQARVDEGAAASLAGVAWPPSVVS